MALNITPLFDRVVIEPKEALTQTKSGLFIPIDAQEKQQEGTVVAVGKGKKDEPMNISVGDVVVYPKHAGTEVELENKTYLIMRQTDIFAVV